MIALVTNKNLPFQISLSWTLGVLTPFTLILQKGKGKSKNIVSNTAVIFTNLALWAELV